jgi:Putative Actinobacterial Holin-X, holin superfamily III
MPDQSQTPPQTPPPASPAPPQVPPPELGPDKRSVADLVIDVSQGTSSLIREEFELAKAEVTEKVGKILRGSVVGIAAGTFAFLALILVMEGIAWLLNEEVFDGKTWPGFFIEAAVFLLVAAAAGYIAYRSVKAGAPPLPEQAIEEAKLTKTMFESEAENLAEGVEKNVVKGAGK